MALVQETIENVLKNINQDNNGGVFLPYIQRDFVWEKERIYRLLDSLMRRYPIGTILAWETNERVNYRPFIKDYDEAHDFDADICDSADGVNRRYILDGQQRLQSLYIARYGSYDKDVLFFDLTSDPDGEFGYVFDFKPEKPQQGTWLNVKKFLDTPYKMASSIPTALMKKGVIPSHFNEEAQERMGQNAMQLYSVFKTFANIPLQTLSVDDGIGLDDIAEVFVRTNSEGIVLEKADLLMALIRGQWAEAKDEFNRLNGTVMAMGYKKPKDFILRACLAMLSGNPGGGKNDARLFAAPEIQIALREKFSEIGAAICDVLRFIADFSFIRSQNVPSLNPVLVLICYRYAHPEEWKTIGSRAKTFLFGAFLSKALNKPSQALMRALLGYAMRDSAFDIAKIEAICRDNGRELSVNLDDILDISMKDSLADLVLHLFYMGKAGHFPEKMTAKDHIFPDSKLSKVKAKGKVLYLKGHRDRILNCELLTPTDNMTKGDSLPEEYLGRCDDDYLRLHGIPSPKPGGINIWDIRFYDQFLKERRAIWEVQLSEKLAGLINGIGGRRRKTPQRGTDKNQLSLDL